MVGGIGAGGIDDGIRAYGKFAANGAKGTLGRAIIHGAKHAIVEGGFAATGGAIGYYNGGVEGALYGANIGSMVGGIAASRMVACFPAGTHLRTPDGSKPIEHFVAGDQIISRDECDVTAPLVTSQVEEVFVRDAFLLNVRVGGQLIQTTAEHPFYVKGFGWLPAGELKPGDEFSTSEGGWVAVEQVKETGKWSTVYNLRVTNCHTYFVGDRSWTFDIWAHNVYEVGTAAALRKNPEPGTVVHHVPQSRQTESLVNGWNPKNKVGNEAAIRIFQSEHDAINAAQAARPRTPASTLELLQQDIDDVTSLTDAPQSTIKKLNTLVRSLHPWDFI